MNEVYFELMRTPSSPPDIDSKAENAGAQYKLQRRANKYCVFKIINVDPWFEM